MYVTLLPISSTATSRVYRNSILEQTYMEWEMAARRGRKVAGVTQRDEEPAVLLPVLFCYLESGTSG